MSRYENTHLTLECRIFSYLLFFFLLLVKNNRGTLLSFLFVYLWITHWKKLKINKKLVILTIIVALFHSFCGKLLIFYKILLLSCFTYSYIICFPQDDVYSLLTLLREKERRCVLEYLICIQIFKKHHKEIRFLDIETGMKRTLEDKLFVYQCLIKSLKSETAGYMQALDRRLYFYRKKVSLFDKKRMDILFLLFHLILLFIWR